MSFKGQASSAKMKYPKASQQNCFFKSNSQTNQNFWTKMKWNVKKIEINYFSFSLASNAFHLNCNKFMLAYNIFDSLQVL